MLEGILNRYEFSLREGRGSLTGISAAFGSVQGWFATEDPFSSLSFNKEIASIRSKLGKRYFETLIENALIKNTHACTVVMEPKPGLEKQRAHAEEARLAKLKASMTSDQIAAIVADMHNLQLFPYWAFSARGPPCC